MRTKSLAYRFVWGVHPYPTKETTQTPGFYALLQLCSFGEETVLTPLSRTKKGQSRGCDGQAVKAVSAAVGARKIFRKRLYLVCWNLEVIVFCSLIVIETACLSLLSDKIASYRGQAKIETEQTAT